MFFWRISKADLKSAFLKTGCAQLIVYVMAPHECTDSFHHWNLLNSAYELEIQMQSDGTNPLPVYEI